MSTYEPSKEEVRATLTIGSLIAPFYSGYIKRLGLQGTERVLDYGSGSGVCSKHLAARLQKGGHLTCVDVSRTWNSVIQNTLRKYSNVDTCVLDLTDAQAAKQLPDSAFDAVFIHFVLHDIPAQERPIIVQRLVEMLVNGGKLYMREPLEPGGMTSAEMRQVLKDAGLRLTSSRHEKTWYAGEMFEGVFQK